MKNKPDRAKFEELFLQYFPKVKSFALLLLKSEQEAEDLAQDIFVRLWEMPELWQDDFEKNYLYTMVKNTIFNRIKRKNIELKYIEQQRELLALSDWVEFHDPLEDIYLEELHLLLMLALEQMPDKRKEVFSLSRFDHLSNREIAEKLKISIRTVEQHIYLALKDIKKALLLAVLLMRL